MMRIIYRYIHCAARKLSALIFPQTRQLMKELRQMALDTTKLLNAVRKEVTENASLRALVAANTAALRDISGQVSGLNDQIQALKDALAAVPSTAALTQQVQDLQTAAAAAQVNVDAAATLLSADDETTASAISENTVTPPPASPPPPPPPPSADPTDPAKDTGLNT